MEHRLNVVSVWIDQKGCIVTRMIGPPLTGRAIAPAARGETRPIERLDDSAVFRLEGEMHTAGQHALCAMAFSRRMTNSSHQIPVTLATHR
jgi:hypothetical protein